MTSTEISGNSAYVFGPFRLDQELRRADATIDLTPKAFQILRILVSNAGELVTKDDLWKAVWPHVIVSDAALTVCVAEIRKALGDDARNASFIATVPKRGYRFIYPVTAEQHAADSCAPDTDPAALFGRELLGRSHELRRLRQCFENALQGERQLCFVTGEVGIGKTTLLNHFLSGLGNVAPPLCAYGQCVEHYGASEPYLPIFDALERLCSKQEDAELISRLCRVAPLWVTQMPGLVDDAQMESLQRRTSTATPERMLRELTHALEEISTLRPLILCLEDIHWADTSTLDWLTYVARHSDASRLMVIATIRSGEGAAWRDAKALIDQLSVKKECIEVALGSLGVEEIKHFISDELVLLNDDAARSMAAVVEVPTLDLASALYARTGGNPLFFTTMFNHLIGHRDLQRLSPPESRNAHGVDAMSADMPADLRGLILRQFTHLSDAYQDALRAGCIVGRAFSVAAAAAALGRSADEVERIYAGISDDTAIIRTVGLAQWPDGNVTTRYEFKHSLYAEVLYDTLAAGQLARQHRLIASAVSTAYGANIGEVAAELAVHFERGHDQMKAAECYLAAGRNALRSVAYREAVAHFRHGIGLLGDNAQGANDDAACIKIELELCLALGSSLIAVAGSATPEIEHWYARAATLARKINDPTAVFEAIFGLRSTALAKAEILKADSFGRELLEIAQEVDDAGLQLEAYLAIANTSFQLGKLASAQRNLSAALAIYTPEAHAPHTQTYGLEPGMFCYSLLALVLELSGRAADAEVASERALVLADDSQHEFSKAAAGNFAAWLSQLREHPRETAEHAQRAIKVADRQGFPTAQILGEVRHGWAIAALGENAPAGISELENAITRWQALGNVLGRPHFLSLLADAKAQVGAFGEALQAVNEALQVIDVTDERWVEATLYRQRSELKHMLGNGPDDVLADLQRSSAIARAQGAPLLEQRCRRARTSFAAPSK